MARKAKRRGWGEGSITTRTVTRNGKRYTYHRGILPAGADGRRAEKLSRDVRVIERWLAEGLKRGRVAPERVVTVGAYTVAWTRDTALRVKPATLEFYQHSLKHIRPLAGLPIDAVTPQHIRDLMAEAGDAGLGNRTIRGFVQTFGYVLAQAEADGIVERNVAKLVRLPPNDPKPPAHFTLDQMRRFLDVAREDELGGLFAVALATGLRRGELLGLEWADVHPQFLSVDVRHGKTKAATRVVPVAGFARFAFTDHGNNQRRRVGDPGALRRGRVWPYRTEYVTRRCAELCAQAGVPRVTPHGLRHTWFTLMAELDVPEEVRMWLGGHNDRKMTRHYSHESERLMRDAVERLGRAVSA